MMERKEIPESIQNQIIGMRRMEGTFIYIDGMLGVKPNTAQKIYKRWEETGDCASAPRSGALKKLTESNLRHIKRHIRHDRKTKRQPLGEIILNLNLPISEQTLK